MADAQSEKRPQTTSFAPKQINSEADRPSILRPSILFILLAIGLTGAIAAWLGFVYTSDDIRIDVSDVAVNSDGNVELTGAQYRGRTESGRRFEITAATARETSKTPGNIDLRDIVAKVYAQNGAMINIKSREGAYSKTGTKVNLVGDVVVFDAERKMRLETEELLADLSSGDMKSDAAVRVTGDGSLVIAQGMQVYENGALIIFNGKPKMTLNNGIAFE